MIRKTPRLENVPEAPAAYSPPPCPARCLPVTRREAWGPATASVHRRCKVAVAARYTHSLQSSPVYLPGETRGTRGNEAAGGRGPAEGWCTRGRNATCWWTSAWAAGSQLVSHCLVAGVLRPLLLLSCWGLGWRGVLVLFSLHFYHSQKNCLVPFAANPHPLT